MISTTLLKQTIKANFPFWLIMTGVQAFCLVAMAGMGGSIAMTAQAFYSLLPGILSGVYIIVTSNKLFAEQVDRGSMAYILSTPVKRSKVALTQMFFMVISLVLMFTLTTLAHIAAVVFAAGAISAADAGIIVSLNLGLLALSLAFSGICFLSSSMFNLSKYSIALGGGFVGAMLLLSFFGMFGGGLAELSNFSIVKLFDIASMLQGTDDFIVKLIILAVLGGFGYALGSIVFSKRDLPL